MTFTSITPTDVINAGHDLEEVASLLQRGMNLAQEVQAIVNAHWQSPERAQKIHKALDDWNLNVAPPFKQQVDNFSQFLIQVVAPTYQQLDQI